MHDEGGEAGGSAWVTGGMALRVEGSGGESEQVIHVHRPFALIGQTADSDIRIIDPAVNDRHVYLHLDRRGVYAVDLVTRTGTRIDGTSQMVGWLRPGSRLEVAGRRIDLLRITIDDQLVEPPPCDDDLLLDEGSAGPLVRVTLEPRRNADGPWTLNSELIFLGWSNCCGIQIRDAAVAKIHCAVVRTPLAAYVVDLCGRDIRVDNQAVSGVAPLNDGDLLTVGATPFTVRVASAPMPSLAGLAPFVARVLKPDDDGSTRSPAESERAVLAWMMEIVREGQGTILRQQGEMQAALTDSLRQLQQDNAALLNAHLSRVEKIDRELESLRAELAQRPDTPTTAPPLPPPPQVAPLQVTRKASEPAGPKRPTTWLLERVNQLEAENRSAWKDLFRRISPTSRHLP